MPARHCSNTPRRSPRKSASICWIHSPAAAPTAISRRRIPQRTMVSASTARARIPTTNRCIFRRSSPGRGCFIGCEPYVNGMAKILAQIEALDIGNIRLFAGDATELLAWAPRGSLARIDLIHPDPWPKRRHWKRRFVQDASIAAMARVLKPDGEFRFVSDIDDYCAWTLKHLARSPDFVWTAERARDWRLPWPDYTMTRYGRKAEREGRHAAYLRFR